MSDEREDLLDLQGRRLASVLKHHDLKSAALARRLGVSPSSVTRWTSGDQGMSWKHAQDLDRDFPIVDGTTPTFSDIYERRERLQRGPSAFPGKHPLNVECSLHLGPAAAYTAAADILDRVAQTTSSQGRRISLTSLHGVSGPRLVEDPLERPETMEARTRFRELMEALAREGWRVFQVFNAPDAERAAHVGRAAQSIEAPYWQIRSYSVTRALTGFVPLVIGDSDLFLGTEDGRGYSVSSAAHLRGPHWVRWGQEVFDNLWSNAPYLVRSDVGPNQEAIDELQRAAV